jgi:hypothetical protein
MKKQKKAIFQNNILLKNEGVHEEFTPQQIEEITKCVLDPLYFIKNYVYIINLDVGLTLFSLYEYHCRFVAKYNHNGMESKKVANLKVKNVPRILLIFSYNYNILILTKKK